MDFRSRGQTTHNSSPASFPSNSKDVPQRAVMGPSGTKHCTSLQVKRLRAARGRNGCASGSAPAPRCWCCHGLCSSPPRQEAALGIAVRVSSDLCHLGGVQAGARERCKPCPSCAILCSHLQYWRMHLSIFHPFEGSHLLSPIASSQLKGFCSFCSAADCLALCLPQR